MAKIIACAAVLGLLFCAQTTNAGAQQAGEPQTHVAAPLKIDSGDLIEVTMYENPDLSGRFRIDENGDITIPLIGHVHVQGMTAEGAAALIEKQYIAAEILQPAESHASVFIAEYATQGITLNGEVRAPGVYPALGVRMLNDVIAAAGGVTPTAASKVIITHRGEPGNQLEVEYNSSALKPIIPQIQLFPGDSVVVPRAGIVYVLGAVNRSGGYVLDGRRPLTVEEVMALSGGQAKAAALKRVQLVRTLDDGKKEMILVPVSEIYKGKAPDVALKDGDILYVPVSRGMLMSEQAISSALGIGTSVAVYRTSNQ